MEPIPSLPPTSKLSWQTCSKVAILWFILYLKQILAENVKHCHYLKNEKCCPFDEIGYMYLHEHSDQCKSQPCSNRLCMNKHQVRCQDVIEDVERDWDNAKDYHKDQCHICRKQLGSKDDLFNHVNWSVKFNTREYQM